MCWGCGSAGAARRTRPAGPTLQETTMADPIRIQYRESGDFIAEGMQEAPRPNFAIPVRTWVTWSFILVAIILLLCFKSALRPGGFDWGFVASILAPGCLVVVLFVFFLRRLVRGG